MLNRLFSANACIFLCLLHISAYSYSLLNYDEHGRYLLIAALLMHDYHTCTGCIASLIVCWNTFSFL